MNSGNSHVAGQTEAAVLVVGTEWATDGGSRGFVSLPVVTCCHQEPRIVRGSLSWSDGAPRLSHLHLAQRFHSPGEG